MIDINKVREFLTVYIVNNKRCKELKNVEVVDITLGYNLMFTYTSTNSSDEDLMFSCFFKKKSNNNLNHLIRKAKDDFNAFDCWAVNSLEEDSINGFE